MMCLGGGGGGGGGLGNQKVKSSGILPSKTDTIANAAAAAQPVVANPTTPNVPTSVDPVVQQARAAAVRKNRVASGSRATILTRGSVVASQRAGLAGVSGTSLTSTTLGAPATNKTLLGQ